MRRFDVLIVGAGHAGAQAAITLRQHGFEGSLAIVGDEPDPPYERPPLSKEYLAGEKAFDRILIRPPAFWSERGVDLILGRAVTAVDARAHSVTVAGGEEIGYGKLVWAAGGKPRPLPCAGSDLAGVHTIRSRADVDRLTAELPGAGRIVIVGGGYIGLEVAAVLRKRGLEIVLLEALDRVLARVAAEPISRFYEAEHRARGVDLRTGIVVEGLEPGQGGLGVRLAGGELLAALMVIVGIGITPAAGPLVAAGAAGADGVDVDAFCRTSLADVFAIGDCAAHENSFAGGARTRLESVQNAHGQAAAAAKAILGKAEPYAEIPWFWSNQYDLKLQTVGLSHGHDDLVVRGDPAARSFSVVYLREDRVVALDCVNAVRDYVQGRTLVQNRMEIARERLADPAVPLVDRPARPGS